MCLLIRVQKLKSSQCGTTNFLHCVPIKILQHDTRGLFCTAAVLKLICISETLHSNGRRWTVQAMSVLFSMVKFP